MEAFPPGSVVMSEPDWASVDDTVALDALGKLNADQRTALVLRYVDDLSVPQVAAHLQRTVHATEALLVRARIAFRRDYLSTGGSDD